MPHPKNAALDVPASRVSVYDPHAPGGFRNIDAPPAKPRLKVQVQRIDNGVTVHVDPPAEAPLDAYAVGRAAGERWAISAASFADLDALADGQEQFLAGFADAALDVRDSCQEPLECEFPQDGDVQLPARVQVGAN